MLRGRPSFTTFLATILLGLPGLLGACSSISEDLSRQLLRPPNGWLAEPADLGIDAEPFEIVLHSKASLTGWWLPHPSAQGRTVVLLHEEATNVSAQHPYYSFLHDAGFNVLTFDPRGYGKSVGVPSLRAWIHDLDAVFDWLQERSDVDREKIALFGSSLGSVAAMWAARTHSDCRAIVFEHLPSLRDMLRENVADDGSALSAYTVGVMEFAGLPEDMEPSDNAPGVKVPALFVTTENETVRDRLALLRAYGVYGGDKSLWIVPGTGKAPHAMLTQDAEYRRSIVSFLTGALDGKPPAIAATASKVRQASDGEAWYEIRLEARFEVGQPPFAVEACAVLPDGSPHFVRTWLEGTEGRVRIKLPEAPMLAAAHRVFDAAADDENVFVPRLSHLSRSGRAIAPLWPRIEELRNDRMPPLAAVELAADLRRAAETEAFHPALEFELADVFAKIGIALLGSVDPAIRAEARVWLQRAVAAVPEHPMRHFWPGPVPTYGFPQQDAVDEAARRLRSIEQGG